MTPIPAAQCDLHRATPAARWRSEPSLLPPHPRSPRSACHGSPTTATASCRPCHRPPRNGEEVHPRRHKESGKTGSASAGSLTKKSRSLPQAHEFSKQHGADFSQQLVPRTAGSTAGASAPPSSDPLQCPGTCAPVSPCALGAPTPARANEKTEKFRCAHHPWI